QVTEVDLDVLTAGGQVGRIAGGEVVQHADRVPARQQGVHEMRAEEAGSPCDQMYRHAAFSRAKDTVFLTGSANFGQRIPKDSSKRVHRPPRKVISTRPACEGFNAQPYLSFARPR